MPRVLYYDPDPIWRGEAERCLSRAGGMAAVPAGSFAEAASLVRAGGVDVVVAAPLADESSRSSRLCGRPTAGSRSFSWRSRDSSRS